MRELLDVVDYRLDMVNESIQELYDIESDRFLQSYEEIDLLELQAIRKELIFILDKCKEIMSKENGEE
jgi:hypothetical protein